MTQSTLARVAMRRSTLPQIPPAEMPTKLWMKVALLFAYGYTMGDIALVLNINRRKAALAVKNLIELRDGKGSLLAEARLYVQGCGPKSYGETIAYIARITRNAQQWGEIGGAS
jgi:DNA-binding CsgD family transcriptional regulator